MKSLLIVTEAFDIGGLETHIRGEIVSLTRAGCSVHLATGHRFNSLLLPQAAVSVTNNLSLGPEATLVDLMHTVDELRRLIREHAIECVHAHPFTSLLPSLVAAELEGVPFVLTLHGPASMGSYYGPLYDFIFTSVVLPSAGLVVAVSREMAELASPYLTKGEAFILPNGVDPHTFELVSTSAESDPRWLVVSRLDSFKVVGIADFIRKAKLVGLPGVLLVGDGPAKEEFQQRLNCDGLADFVEFCGMSADVPQLIQSVAGVAGMGRVVLEGLASRKPVCLVGYDGVKGLVDQDLLARASKANFSGRNLKSIDSHVFCEQFEHLSKINVTALYEIVNKRFSEPCLWVDFLENLKEIEPQTPTLLSDIYRSLLASGVNETVPLLQSAVLFEQLGRLIHSPRHYEPSLIANFLYHQNKFTDMKFNQTVAECDAQNASLNLVVAERDRRIDELQAIRVMEHREMMRLSDWALKINEHPLRHGIKKHLREIAKVFYHRLPISIGTKQQIRVVITRVLRWSSGLGASVISTGGNSKDAYSGCQATPHPSSIVAKSLLSSLCALAQGRGALNARDLFFFSIIDWHFRIQRPQQLARSFAKAGKRVFYFSNHFVDSASPGYEIERLDPKLELYQIKLHVRGAPAIYFAPPTAEALAMMEQGVSQLIRDFAAVSSVSLVEHGYWYHLAARLPNTLRVYDCMDHHEGFGNVPEELIKIEKTMLRESDLVVVTSTMLEEIARGYNGNIAVIRNAGEYEHFSELPKEFYVDAQGRKIIGYYGAIAEWFDLDLIRAIATAQPEALVMLVGNDTIRADKALKDLPNVVLIGEVPYAQLPYYLYAFDVCLLPFKVIPLTLATNPVKVYEYLAAGKPVVCVDLPEIAQFGDLLHRAKTADEFVCMVKDSIALSDTDIVRQQRRQFASEQTWSHRAAVLAQAIEEIPLPKISVVVLTYNNLDLTKACIDSLLRWSMYPNIEIIVVDNASTDGTPLYLRGLQALHPHVRLILNEKNLGFAAGNNAGLVAATGDYLVMLNNDTVVTPGWLLTMLRHLQADPTIGMVGPVTNNIGNEAKIDIQYRKSEDMLPLAIAHTSSHMGRRITIRTAAFFCVMMSRKVFEQVGLLDEHFGRGFFEDDDYCRRVEQFGLRLVCAGDVFVHHHLSASFNKLGSGEKEALFAQNKTYYESKWGQWIPHEYRTSPCIFCTSSQDDIEK